MPRGIAMHSARDQLFDAAERVLASAGPVGLTSRAVTDEAGVAKGLIYRYFIDLDEFLAEFTATKVRHAVESVSSLADRAGSRTVTGNLSEALLALFGPGSHVPAITGLVTSRPSLIPRLHRVLAETSAFGAIEDSLAAYIKAEQGLGRLTPSANPATEAAILLGAVHHLVFAGQSADLVVPSRVQEIVTAVIAGMAPVPPGDRR